MTVQFGWATKSAIGYECSSKGDKTYSAFNARMPDGRTIEQWYQCDVKGYCPGSTDWQMGKGKPPRVPYADDSLWQMYLSLWRIWALHHPNKIKQLREHALAHNNTLTDMFASTEINQARALATILNEWMPL